MTKPRPLPNNAKWVLEDVHQRLIEIERQLAPIMDNNQHSKIDILQRTARARIAAAKAREHILSVHPSVARKRP